MTKKEKTYLVVDSETTIYNSTIGNNKANPFLPENQIVSLGYKSGDSDLVAIQRNSVDTLNPRMHIVTPGLQCSLLVGHNLKFDMHYMRKEGVVINGVPFDDYIKTATIWDTQAVEYILSGQYHLYPKLDALSAKYGGHLKDDRIKAYWDAGVNTEDIPEDMLHEYLEGDVLNTELVFEHQVTEAIAKGKLPLIRSMMKAIVAYAEMEWNGMAIDTAALAHYSKIENDYLRDIDLEILAMLPADVRLLVDVNSPQQLSCLLFGGDLKYTVVEQVGYYKNGNPKYKKIQKTITDPFLKLPTHPEWEMKKEGIYKTSDEVIGHFLRGEEEEGYTLGPVATKFLSLMKERRIVSKEISGYYDSIPKLLHVDNTLHQNINTCSTSTGRSSQNAPNLQNVSTSGQSNVKHLFISRHGKEGGYIIEADYKQLEVIALAFLSRDAQLIDDLVHGRDMHDETLKKVKHLLPGHLSDKEKRRVVKSINFGLIYGGGAKTLGVQAGVPTKVAKAVIDAFYDRYSGVKDWQESLLREVRASRRPTHMKTELGFPRGMGKLQSITGREYTFLEYDAPAWLKAKDNIDVGFSPSQVDNYPVQGFATGDIVPLMVGTLYHALKSSSIAEDCLMINTVHDSIIFDCKKEVVEEACELIKTVMESAPKVLKEVFGIDFDMPLKVDVTYGPSWKDQTFSY